MSRDILGELGRSQVQFFDYQTIKHVYNLDRILCGFVMKDCWLYRAIRLLSDSVIREMVVTRIRVTLSRIWPNIILRKTALCLYDQISFRPNAWVNREILFILKECVSFCEYAN